MLNVILFYIKTFLGDKKGATATEYAVVIFVLILVAIGGVTALGFQINTVFEAMDTALETAPVDPG